MPKKYLCGIAFQHELGETEIAVFDSIKELKKSGVCWKQCGIVEILVKEDDDPEFYYSHKWITKQDLFGKKSKKDPKAKT